MDVKQVNGRDPGVGAEKKKPITVAGEVRLTGEARAYYLLIPFGITLGVLAFFTALHGWDYTGKLLGYAVAQFVAAGKFIIFAGVNREAAADGFAPHYLALLVIYMDVLVGSIVMINIAVFYKLPFIGRKLDNIQRHSMEMLDANHWAEKLTFLSLMAFVAFPLTGTGAIGGGFFGRMLGLSRKQTFLGLVCGSTCGAGLMYVLANLFGNLLKTVDDNPLIKWGLIVGGFVFIGLFIYVLTGRVKKGFSKTRKFDKKEIEAELKKH